MGTPPQKADALLAQLGEGFLCQEVEIDSIKSTIYLIVEQGGDIEYAASTKDKANKLLYRLGENFSCLKVKVDDPRKARYGWVWFHLVDTDYTSKCKMFIRGKAWSSGDTCFSSLSEEHLMEYVKRRHGH